jgi:hypothetical protein
MKSPMISVAAAAVAGVVAYAAENGPVLAVCVEHRETVNNLVMAQAQAIVSQVFAQAGMRIDWIPSRLCRIAGANAIRVEMDLTVPAHFGSETLAYALPYDGSGTTIHIFNRRIMESHRELGAEILGHVIAHEIGHVLEGIARHSPDGLMKAHWGLQDYMRMKKQRLSFSAEDVQLMRPHVLSADGLAARSGRE